jgi:hypothetical protein
MNDQIIAAIYCLYDDHLKSMELTGNRWYKEKMNDAKVMTIAIILSCSFIAISKE